MANHRWTESDDVAALYVYRFGTARLGISAAQLAESRGITAGSFDMRVRNFGALCDEGNLTHVARQSQRIFDRHEKTSETELRRLVQRA